MAEYIPDPQFDYDFNRALALRVTHVLTVLHIPVLRNLAVDANHGIITLRGSVRTYYQRQIANSTVRRVPGVTGLIDRIEVIDPTLGFVGIAESRRRTA